MPTYTCPQCGEAITRAPEYEGLSVICPHCGEAVRFGAAFVPAPPPPPPPRFQPIEPAPRRPKRTRPQARRQPTGARPFLRRAMVVVTVLWLLVIPVVAVQTNVRISSIGSDSYLFSWSLMQWSLWRSIRYTGAFYAAAIASLGVFYFASRDDG